MLCEAKASFSSTRSMSADLHSGARQQLAHGRDRADAHDARVDARDGAAREGRQRLDAERAGPLLARDHERRGAVVDAARVAGRHAASGAEGGLQLGQALGRRVGPRMLVDRHLADGDQLVCEAAGCLRLGPALLRAQRERVLVLAADVVALGHVLARLAHALEREHRLHRRIGEAPAERGVVERAVAARECALGLGGHERRAAHRLDSTGHEEVAVAREHGVAGGRDGREPRRAEAVQRHARDGLRQAGQQRAHARDVAVVLAGLVRAAEVDVLDLAGVDACALDRRRDRDAGEVVGAHQRERACIPADGRAHRREQHCARHAGPSSASTSWAIAKAPLAAGAPQ